MLSPFKIIHALYANMLSIKAYRILVKMVIIGMKKQSIQSYDFLGFAPQRLNLSDRI